MADAVSYDWKAVTGRTVERLRAPKIQPVPAEITKLAQASYDEGKVKSYEFPTEEVAAAFAKHMKNAGHHTTPLTSVSVVIDPDDTGNTKLVHWKAGARRGAKPV